MIDTVSLFLALEKAFSEVGALVVADSGVIARACLVGLILVAIVWIGVTKRISILGGI